MKDFQEIYFQQPHTLWLLLLLPVAVFLYRRANRQRWENALRFSYTSVLEHLKHSPAPWKQALPGIILLVTLTCLIVTMARPTVVAKIPVKSLDIMLVMDVSLSMMADDIAPDRLSAARETAIAFIRSLPRDTRVGLTLFSGNTVVASPLTSNHREVEGLLSRLNRKDLRPNTEIGTAIEASLQVMRNPDEDAQKAPQLMVLVSDGDSQDGYPWHQAALHARQNNIRIHTIGIGTDRPLSVSYQGQSFPVTFNEGILQQIAEVSSGRYFRAASRKDFEAIYQQVRERAVRYEDRPEDLGYFFAAVAFLALVMGQGISVFWLKRFP